LDRVFPQSPTCTNLTYHGRPAEFPSTVCLANVSGLNREVTQPLAGENIYTDFLASKGEGAQHFLFDCNGLGWEEKTATLEAAGYSRVQSGKWRDRVSFAYYGTEASIGTIVEVVDRPQGWQRPEPEETIG
jgi:methylmalonyl-CoA/ethylmalonyl-CoA epimerase